MLQSFDGKPLVVQPTLFASSMFCSTLSLTLVKRIVEKQTKKRARDDPALDSYLLGLQHNGHLEQLDRFYWFYGCRWFYEFCRFDAFYWFYMAHCIRRRKVQRKCRLVVRLPRGQYKSTLNCCSIQGRSVTVGPSTLGCLDRVSEAATAARAAERWTRVKSKTGVKT